MQKQCRGNEYAGGEIRIQRHRAEAGPAVQVGGGAGQASGHFNLEIHP